MTYSEQLAVWADKLRDLAALGWRYTDLQIGRIQDADRVWRGDSRAQFDF